MSQLQGPTPSLRRRFPIPSNFSRAPTGYQIGQKNGALDLPRTQTADPFDEAPALNERDPSSGIHDPGGSRITRSLGERFTDQVHGSEVRLGPRKQERERQSCSRLPR